MACATKICVGGAKRRLKDAADNVARPISPQPPGGSTSARRRRGLSQASTSSLGQPQPISLMGEKLAKHDAGLVLHTGGALSTRRSTRRCTAASATGSRKRPSGCAPSSRCRRSAGGGSRSAAWRTRIHGSRCGTSPPARRRRPSASQPVENARLGRARARHCGPLMLQAAPHSPEEPRSISTCSRRLKCRRVAKCAFHTFNTQASTALSTRASSRASGPRPRGTCSVCRPPRRGLRGSGSGSWLPRPPNEQDP